ncbi:MAG: hypothetical protein Q8O67_09720 [Deltaproteobacteria bacterium]|nr:hypothetical protein [Deltaproteobacteria bacterium]
MTSSSSSPASIGTSVGRALGALLRGAEPEWPSSSSLPSEEILERHDVDAALLLAWQRALPRRITDAVGHDAVDVLLPDGSSLDVTRTETLLADKEHDRCYPPLRRPLAVATRPFRQFRDRRSELLRGLLIDDDVIADDVSKRLAGFLASTIDEMTACRELLASQGGVELADEDAVVRGLDLPGPVLFTDRLLAAFVRQALPALPAGALTVQRVAAPRLCAGHVVVDQSLSERGAAVVRLWSAPTLSAGRFVLGARGAGRLLAAAVSAPVHAPGLGLAVVDVEARRGLSESKGDALRAFQICAATLLLLARARAAVTLVALRRLDLEEETEEARGAVRKALGADGGAELASLLLLPPLPDGGPLRSPRHALIDRSNDDVDAAGSWLGLRDEFDAGFLLRPRRLEGLRELPGFTGDPALAWRRLLGELL